MQVQRRLELKALTNLDHLISYTESICSDFKVNQGRSVQSKTTAKDGHG